MLPLTVLEERIGYTFKNNVLGLFFQINNYLKQLLLTLVMPMSTAS